MSDPDGADHFDFPALPWNAGHISDFTPGTDLLDLRTLFAAAGYHGANPLGDGTLHLDDDGAGGTKVLLTTPSSPWPTLITTLDHVAPANLHAGDWLF